LVLLKVFTKGGVLIQTDFASFRETSSNLSNGNVIEFSITKLAPNEKKILEDAMYKKIPVTIEFSKELIGSPFIPLKICNGTSPVTSSGGDRSRNLKLGTQSVPFQIFEGLKVIYLNVVI
jgi:hypothetical protein